MLVNGCLTDCHDVYLPLLQGRTGQRGHAGMPGSLVRLYFYTDNTRAYSAKFSECRICFVLIFQGFPGPQGGIGAEGKPGTQVPILYSHTMITVYCSFPC